MNFFLEVLVSIDAFGKEFCIKRIVCYGDSNTWGYDPAAQNRMDENTRWTRILGKSLGAGYEVIEEGLNGRTTVWDDPIEGHKNGKTYLAPCIDSHRPFDLIILMLGTNDLKKRFSLPASDIAQGAAVLVRLVQQSDAGRNDAPPAILLLAPPPTVQLTRFSDMFEGAGEKSRDFPVHFARAAKELGCHFLDTATIIVSSPIDGIHFESGEHTKLGKALAKKVKDILD